MQGCLPAGGTNGSVSCQNKVANSSEMDANPEMDLLRWRGRRHSLFNRRPRGNVSLPPPPSPFEVEENILVYFEQLPYHAKVLKRAVYGGRHWRYYVHYYGWKKRWDEWVDVKRILKYNDENAVIMRDKKAGLNNGTHWLSKHPEKPQKLIDWIDKDREALGRKLFVDIPPPLYFAWVEDKDVSLHVGQISRVPTRARTVQQILLEDFQHHLEGEVGELEEQREAKLHELVRRFDDKFLELRYKSESKTSPPENLRPSQAYGVLHLLRMLFVNLPEEPIQGGFEDLGRSTTSFY